MRVLVRSRFLVLLAAFLCVTLATGLAGCVSVVEGNDEHEAVKDLPAEPEEPGVEMVTVPDVLGSYYGDASARIEEAGLVPVDVSVHGPIDEDAGEIGRVYRATPAAGEKVPKGTTVELRSWWESQ